MKETKFKQTLVQMKEGSRHCEERGDVAIQGGFKMTEVGMIPSDWGVEPLANIANTASGGTPSRSNEAFYKGSIKWFTTTELKDCNLYDSVEHISKQAVECSSAKIFPKNTLLMAMYGATIGKLGLLKCDAATNQACCAIFPKKTDVLYLYYFLLHNRENIIAMGCGAGQPNVSQEIVKKIKIPLPPTIEEQQHIANAHSDVDTLINNLEKLIAKKKNIKQGAMQQLLTGKKRLPGFAPDERTGSRPTDERRKACHSERSAKREVEESSGYKMTELGLIPSDWEVKTFGELFDILPNNTLSRAELNEDSGSFKNIHYGDVLVKFPEWIDCSKNTLPFINSGAKFNHTALQDGDVIIADTAEDETVGKSTEIYNVGKMKIVSGLHTIPIRPKKKFASKWLGYFINSACWHDQILPFITGTKVSAISKTAIAETKFFYPAKIDEQTAIANVLSDMDTEISALETKLAKYRTLKTGMMQQLLTGKIRLV